MPGVRKNDRVVNSYHFLLGKEKSEAPFTVDEVVQNIGWAESSVRTYITKKWGRFLRQDGNNYYVTGVSAYQEDGYVRLMSQKDELSNNPQDPHSVEVGFDFPDAVKTACEQYLLYFAEFLRDVGVEATAALHEREGGHVLFSVTPNDKEEALDTIRDALTVYLQLPTKPITMPMNPLETSIEVQRLAANIQHLQGQLLLANAAIQQKELIVQQQQALIQQQLLTGNILVQSLHQEAEKDDDAEPVLGDIVAVKRFEWQAIEIDLPTLVRRLKEHFGRK